MCALIYGELFLQYSAGGEYISNVCRCFPAFPLHGETHVFSLTPVLSHHEDEAADALGTRTWPDMHCKQLALQACSVHMCIQTYHSKQTNAPHLRVGILALSHFNLLRLVIHRVGRSKSQPCRIVLTDCWNPHNGLSDMQVQ